jgi:hypothetical protein
MENNGWGGVFALSVIASFLLTIESVTWCSSVSRYFLPPLLISFALAAVVVDRFGKRSRPIWTALLLALAFFSGAGPLLTNYSQPLFTVQDGSELSQKIKHTTVWYAFNTAPRDKLRLMPQAYGSEEIIRQIGNTIDANAITQIGLENLSGQGIYNVIYPFSDKVYDLRYINPVFLPEKEDAEFLPEMIIAREAHADSPDEDMPVKEYHGAEYEPIEYLPVNCGYAAPDWTG